MAKGAHLMGAVGALAPTVFLPRLEIIHINVPLFLPHSKLYLHMDPHYLVQLGPSDHFHQFFAHFCLRFWLNIWLVLHQFWFKSFFFNPYPQKLAQNLIKLKFHIHYFIIFISFCVRGTQVSGLDYLVRWFPSRPNHLCNIWYSQYPKFNIKISNVI